MATGVAPPKGIVARRAVNVEIRVSRVSIID
jgi:hypothetical protein